MRHENIFLLTDGCAWEKNKRNDTEHPHSIEVVDIKTGAVRFIRSGSKISFIEGEITDVRSQSAYNEATSMSSRRKGVDGGAICKKKSEGNKSQTL